MDKLIARAEKKTVAVLRKELFKRSNYGVGVSDFKAERYLKHYYLKEFWKVFYQIADGRFKTGACDCSSMDNIFSTLQQHEGWTLRNLLNWIEIKTAHHTFRILEAKGAFYIVAAGMDALPVNMTLSSLVKVVTAFDEYMANNDFIEILNQAMLENSAEEKAKEILTMTARTFVEDLLEGEDVNFEVHMQKNGRLCCTINPRITWLPTKVFRTSFETFREDFIKAYKAYKLRIRCNL